MRPRLDLGGGDDRREGETCAEGLGEGDDVGYDPVALERVPLAGAAEPGLRLVEDRLEPPPQPPLLRPPPLPLTARPGRLLAPPAAAAPPLPSAASPARPAAPPAHPAAPPALPRPQLRPRLRSRLRRLLWQRSHQQR